MFTEIKCPKAKLNFFSIYIEDTILVIKIQAGTQHCCTPIAYS